MYIKTDFISESISLVQQRSFLRTKSYLLKKSAVLHTGFNLAHHEIFQFLNFDFIQFLHETNSFLVLTLLIRKRVALIPQTHSRNFEIIRSRYFGIFQIWVRRVRLQPDPNALEQEVLSYQTKLTLSSSNVP